MAAAVWDFLGDEEGTYESLLGLYRAVGREYAAKLDELRRALAGREL